MESNPWIYTPDRDNTARYTLGQPSDIGRNLVCFGINPSTAEPENLDPTLKSVKRIAIANGYDGWVMLNVYPQRATNPNDMHDEVDSELHTKNLEHIAELLEQYECDIWAAWGTLIEKRKYLIPLLHDIYQATRSRPKIRWVSYGKISTKGHPHHPLYLRNDSTPLDFDMENYIQQCIL